MLNKLSKLSHRQQVRFALFCAKQVEYLWKDVPEAIEAVRAVELWLEGRTTREKCMAAGDSAHLRYLDQWASKANVTKALRASRAVVSVTCVVAFPAEGFRHALNVVNFVLACAKTVREPSEGEIDD